MAAIQPVTAASPGGGDVSIRMPAAAEHSEPQPKEGDGGAPANPKQPENHLSRFVRCVAFGEWAGNAFGALAFVWATGVLLGGFCSSLNPQDFWFASVVIFIEAFRIFSRSYKMDSQSLFGTTRALRWINSSFLRMLWRPQEGGGVVLAIGLWINLVYKLHSGIGIIASALIFEMALLIPWSRRPPRRPRKWQMRAVAIAYLLVAAYKVVYILIEKPQYEGALGFLFYVLPVLIDAGAVLLLNLRPRRLTNLTTTPWGRRLISLAKVTSALWLAAELLVGFPLVQSVLPISLYNLFRFNTSFAILTISLGSLQNDHDADTNTSLLGHWTDAVIHICFIFHFVAPFPVSMIIGFLPDLSPLPCVSLSLVLLLVWLLIGNLQIPAAVAQIVLSSLRLRKLLHHPRMDYNHLPPNSSPNMVPAIAVFYVLSLCQGSFYVMASFLALFSPFPRRWLMRRSKFGGKLGAKAIDLYYERAYTTRMEMGMFGAAGSSMTFADFAIESLSSSSSSRDQQVAGLCVLHNMLQEERRRDDCSTQRLLLLRVTSSSTAVSTLVGMLAWTDVVEDEHSYLIIRLLAARVTAELAGSLRISSIPGMLNLLSSLLRLAENADAVVVVPIPNQQGGPDHQQAPLAIATGGRWRSSVICRFWQRMKQEYWSVPEEPTLSLTHQDSSLPVLGMVILEKLARDLDNCVEIFKDDTATLISKTIGIIGWATASDNELDDALVCSSLEFLRRLATTGERIGAALRQELWNHSFLLTSLARVLEDDHGSPRLWEPAMDIIAKLALDTAAGHQIGRIQVITARLLHAFLGRHGHGPTNMYYDPSLRKVSGEALANLALWGTANCLAILEEPGYQVINDLTNMLSDDDHNRYVAAGLLLNICEHCSVNLSSALSTVMKYMKDAEGKQLESLISLASEIGDVTREAFVRELGSQTNSGAELVQKLVSTLNSKKIPNPEYPRMRRVIVKIMISILESCRGTVEKLTEEGMMQRLLESLTKIERSPSRVEEYRVFYGNIGVVPEYGEPMSDLVARAKALLVKRTTQCVSYRL